ncbi:MAG TPA: DUF445 domain-containing protein [Candidatus Limnocylindrales bacterium]|nr:DUF445 domain-containing protein [Candidatus Limnocylindrales bacterium]
MAASRRNRVGGISLSIAILGALAAHFGPRLGLVPQSTWLSIVGAGFEAAVIGGLADWFAVTALFRHPLGIPIPHTAIIPARRAKMTEAIVNMVEEEWLSPEVIGQRLARLSPSEAVVDWFGDASHAQRVAAPLRDLLRGLARTLTEREVVDFSERTLRGQLADLRIDATAGKWLARIVRSPTADAAFTAFATSLANIASRPRTSEQLHWWLEQSATALHARGRRFVPFLLRRRTVREKIVEAACEFASAELRDAADDLDHPLRHYALDTLGGFAERVEGGDPEALARIEGVRAALVESLEAGPLVRDVLSRLRAQIERDLGDPKGTLSQLIERKLQASVLQLLDHPDRRATFDQWVRTTAQELLSRHHHQIGLTVRESLEALETDRLVQQIEDRVGADLQYIRLNGAVVGGLVGMMLAVARLFAQV